MREKRRGSESAERRGETASAERKERRSLTWESEMRRDAREVERERRAARRRGGSAEGWRRSTHERRISAAGGGGGSWKAAAATRRRSSRKTGREREDGMERVARGKDKFRLAAYGPVYRCLPADGREERRGEGERRFVLLFISKIPLFSILIITTIINYVIVSGHGIVIKTTVGFSRNHKSNCDKYSNSGA